MLPRMANCGKVNVRKGTNGVGLFVDCSGAVSGLRICLG